MDRLSDYDYFLPEDRIAQVPLADRAASKLLTLDRRTGRIEHRTFRDIARILKPGDLLVLNDTRVTARRIFGRKPTGAEVEFLLVREMAAGAFEAMVRPGRRLKPGARVNIEDGLVAIVGPETTPPLREVQFSDSADLPARLERLGHVPLPPYITKELADPERYQTVYATTGGSAAAPTAGLHFTPELLAELRQGGIQAAAVTLDVSLDTFRPVEAENLDDHSMHGETATVPPETARAIQNCPGRIVAVGTTVVRTLESFAEGHRQVRTGTQSTKLFIRPGYEFQVVDAMLTNFHLPKTSMMVLVSAMAERERVMSAYAEALAHGYRFLSFGDSMLVI